MVYVGCCAGGERTGRERGRKEMDGHGEIRRWKVLGSGSGVSGFRERSRGNEEERERQREKGRGLSGNRFS